VVARRPSVPILDCVRVEPTGGLVQFTATDGFEVSARLGLTTTGPQLTRSFCINLASLAATVKARPKHVKEISMAIEVEPATTTTTNEEPGLRPGRARINGVEVEILSDEKFPPVVPAEATPVPMPGLLKALRAVAPS
jgi:hypothetical protein